MNASGRAERIPLPAARSAAGALKKQKPQPEDGCGFFPFGLKKSGRMSWRQRYPPGSV